MTLIGIFEADAEVVFGTLQLSFEHTLISQSPSKHSARGSTERERELDKNT